MKSNKPNKVRVLLSVSGPSNRTNPFVTLVAESVEHAADTHYFSWRLFALGRYDVLHLHWPEEIIRGRNVVYSMLKSILVLIIAVWIRVVGKPVVWTVHNPYPHEELKWWEKRAYNALLGCVNHRVYLTLTMVGDYSGEFTVIPHGDYTPTIGADLMVTPALDFLYFGRIKPYKGVPQLLNLFSNNQDFRHSLRICGYADSHDQRQSIEQTVDGDDRFTSYLGYLEESQLHREILNARVVVLPYLEMYNSGAILLALSLGRPVVVPKSPATDELAAEIGPRWVMTYDEELSTDFLQKCLEFRPDADELPVLDGRSWSKIGKKYAEVYEMVQRRRR